MDLQKKIGFLARFVCESDAIEGITDDPELVALQLEKHSACGHVGALLLLEKYALQKAPLTNKRVRRVQSLIVTEQPEKGAPQIAEKYRGNWRDCNVWIVERKGGEVVEETKKVSPERVPSLMSTLIERIAQWQTVCAGFSAAQNIIAIAGFHYDYEQIHPFVDGNGRSGRALVYYLYRFAGLVPFVFTAQDRHETYYPCFRDRSPETMCKYFLERTALAT
ncbi:MAG: Fic family protein [bacterium]|nr:Fic family protein [bacterium]